MKIAYLTQSLMILALSLINVTSLNSQVCNPNNPQCPEGQYCKQGQCTAMPASPYSSFEGEGGIVGAGSYGLIGTKKRVAKKKAVAKKVRDTKASAAQKSHWDLQ